MESNRELKNTEQAGTDEEGQLSRRDLLVSLGKWSKIVIGAAVFGSVLMKTGREAEAGTAAWANRGGGGGWVNHGGGGGAAWGNHSGGGAVWANHGGGGTAAWANHGGGGTAWVNRGAAWANHGSAWVNRY